MAQSSTNRGSCTAQNSEASPYNILARVGSSTFSTSTIANLSAASLVIASAGFGGLFAWSVGSQHGVIMAALMVLFAVALELAKPLSLAAALDAFRSWSLARGLALGLLATVAIAYSLTAELTLMAGSRGDLIAKREAVIKATSDADADAQRAKDRYEAAKVELASLPITRPASEVQAEIAAIDQLPGIVIDGQPCGGTLNGRVTKEWCPKRNALIAEKARAERRAELETIVALPVVRPDSREPEVKSADPGATALATYLAALGFTIKVGVLTEWLALIPVLALEIGSALAGVLVQTFRAPVRPQPLAVVQGASKPALPSVVQGVVQAPKTGVSAEAVQAQEEVEKRILDHLKKQGGAVRSSERGLARLIAGSKTTTRRAVNSLVVAGILAAEATRNGTVLRLLT